MALAPWNAAIGPQGPGTARGGADELAASGRDAAGAEQGLAVGRGSGSPLQRCPLTFTAPRSPEPRPSPRLAVRPPASQGGRWERQGWVPAGWGRPPARGEAAAPLPRHPLWRVCGAARAGTFQIHLTSRDAPEETLHRGTLGARPRCHAQAIVMLNSSTPGCTTGVATCLPKRTVKEVNEFVFFQGKHITG